MSAECTSYYSTEKLLVGGFTCPKKEGDANAIFCCGFNDIKYCCDDPNSFFPYEYGYMWWLSVGALIGLSIAAIVLLAFIVTVCVFCYLFIAAKPSRLDNGLPLQAPGSVDASQLEDTHLLSHPEGKLILGSSASEEPGLCSAPGGPQGFRKHFLSRKLDCDNQPPASDRIFQRCFLATVPAVSVEGP